MKNKIKSTKLILIFIVVNLFFSSQLCAQDIVILRNGDEFKAKVEEVSDDVIKYYKWENLKGAKYSVKKADVFMIRYQTGYVEKYTVEKPEISKVEPEKKKEENPKRKELSNSLEKPDSLKLDLFVNTGSVYLFEINGLQRDLCLSASNNSYFEFGIGFKKSLKNNNFLGVDFVLGNQNYYVDAPYFYQKIKSSIPYNNVLSNWNIMDRLRLYKIGLASSYTIENKKANHRFKMGFGLSGIIIQDFTSNYEYQELKQYSITEHFDISTMFSNSINVESNIKYEKRILNNLGIEFNLGLSYFPVSSTKQIQDWHGNTRYEFNDFHFLQIKYGVGLLLY